MLQRFHLEVRRTHPGFERAERVFDGFASHAHHAGTAVETRLHALEYIFAHPSSDTPFLAGRAVALQRTGLTDIGPIDPHLLTLFFARHPVRQMLAGGAYVVIHRRIVDEVALVEPALRFRIRGRGFWNVDRDAGVLARCDLVIVEVALVGNDLDGLGVERLARLLRHR